MPEYCTRVLSSTNQSLTPTSVITDEKQIREYQSQHPESTFAINQLSKENRLEKISENDKEKRQTERLTDLCSLKQSRTKDHENSLLSEPSNVIAQKTSYSVTSRKTQFLSKLQNTESVCKAVQICQNITKNSGVHSVTNFKAAGFEYTKQNDTAHCKSCGLYVKEWTVNMDPFSIHAQRSPHCELVKSIRKSSEKSLPNPLDFTMISTNVMSNHSDESEIPSKRQKLESTEMPTSVLLTFPEVNMVKEIRHRTFSHWSHRASPSKEQMIEAGFFSCNVGDRVLCLYCNLICQQWTPHTDDPSEVHKILSPNCLYVVNMLARRETTPISIINQVTSRNSAVSATATGFHSPEIVLAAGANQHFMEIPKREQSFSTWPKDQLPAVDDFVRAGFFYTGTGTIVTCFYCSGSLQNWGASDNPTVEHARWFPHCAYAKQLCGDDLYRKIQESKRVAQERAKIKDSNVNANGNGGKLQILDESTLSRFVAARLDLPVSQRVLAQKFKLSIIKRCWEDQLRMKFDDFVHDCDLLLACMILDKQINCINGKKENIIVPSVRMRQLREENESATSNGSPRISNVEMNSTPQTTNTESSCRASNHTMAKDTTITSKNSVSINTEPTHSTNDDAADSCVLCMTEPRALACIPCGHLATCVPCGHSLRLCPMCRQKIDAFIRIYT